jgi:glycosyltransferase involved in cell wall biosynthesis
MAFSYARVAAPVIAQRARDFDVVHAWADGFVALGAVNGAHMAGRPVLVTPFVHRGQWGEDPASAIAYRRADRAVGLLQDNCSVLRDLGAASERVVECAVCSPGVERGYGAQWRLEHGVSGPLILFLGVRRAYKGFDVLVSALPEIGRALPDATVVFAGPGAAIEADASVRIIDRGRVSDAERAALLEAADVLCLPSAGEIYPSSILEAWSAETAVITSDIPPLAELMQRSGGGRAVPREPAAIARAVVEVLSGPSAEMGAAGYRFWRSEATVDAVVQRHLELYREVIAERRNGAGA